MAERSAKLARWEGWAVKGLKVLILAALFSVALFFFWSCVRAAIGNVFGSDELAPRVFFGAFYLFMGTCSLLFAYGIWKEVPLQPSQTAVRGAQPSLKWMTELRAVRPSALAGFEQGQLDQSMKAGNYQQVIDDCQELLQSDPADLIVLLYRACALYNLLDARADDALRELASHVPSDRSSVHAGILGLRIGASLFQGDFELFLAACKRYLEVERSETARIAVLDQVACIALFRDMRDRYEFAEFCARKAVALAPELLTVKGTLGGVLVEKGEFTEAEPLLQRCFDESPAPHDRAISAYYLAVVHAHRGEKAKASELLRSAGMFPAPWLTEKVRGLRDRLGGEGQTEAGEMR